MPTPFILNFQAVANRPISCARDPHLNPSIHSIISIFIHIDCIPFKRCNSAFHFWPTWNSIPLVNSIGLTWIVAPTISDLFVKWTNINFYRWRSIVNVIDNWRLPLGQFEILSVPLNWVLSIKIFHSSPKKEDNARRMMADGLKRQSRLSRLAIRNGSWLFKLFQWIQTASSGARNERKKQEKSIAIISIECSVKVHPRHGGGE